MKVLSKKFVGIIIAVLLLLSMGLLTTPKFSETFADGEKTDPPKEFLNYNIGAINLDGSNYNVIIYLKKADGSDFTLANGAWVTNVEATVGAKVSVNGVSLASHLAKYTGHGAAHWVNTEGGNASSSAGLRFDFSKTSPNNTPDYVCPIKDGEPNIVDIARGIEAPGGFVLPMIRVNITPGTPQSSVEYQTKLPDTSVGDLTVKGISEVKTPDAENYAINVSFNQTVASALTINQENDYYIYSNLKINGKSVKDIMLSATANPLATHWFVDDVDSKGYLAIYMKKAISENYKLKLDGSDTIEFMSGFRSNSNLELKNGITFVLNDKGVWEENVLTVKAAVQAAKVGANYEYLVEFDQGIATADNFSKPLDKTKILVSGAQVTKAELVSSFGGYSLKVTLPVASVNASVADVLGITEGFKVPNGYVLKSAYTSGAMTLNPTTDKTEYSAVLESAIINADIAVDVDLMGKIMTGLKNGAKDVAESNFSLVGNALTLKKEYLTTLGEGTHTFKVETCAGNAEFKIITTVKPDDGGNNPDDGGNPPKNDDDKKKGCGSELSGAAGGAAVISGAFILAAVVLLRKKTKSKIVK